MIVDTMVFDRAQITSKLNYSVPKWGGACHPLTSMCGEAIVIIKKRGRQSACDREQSESCDNQRHRNMPNPSGFNGNGRGMPR